MSDCIEWAGNISPRGYGRLRLPGSRKTKYAHRVAWEKHNGLTIPDGMVICHSCDNRKCVNPAHLWLGTQGDNQRDCTAKGRRAYGERNGKNTKPEAIARGAQHWKSKLDEDAVRHIRSSRGKITQQVLADLYGVPQTSISAVQLNKTWNHVK